MLTALLSLVAAENWFDISTPYEKTVYLSHGSAHSIVLSRNGRPDTFIKFSELMSLQLESERCALASACFPGLAPEFLGHAVSGRLEVLAARAISFRAVPGALNAPGRRRRQFADGLEQYFRIMGKRGHEGRGSSRGHAWFDVMPEYFDRFGAHDLRASTAQGLATLAEMLPTLPEMPQHGDFVLNNLGLRTEGGLVIFDWEDYGAIALPGLDLFTLQASVQHEAAGTTLDLDRFCTALGLPRESYSRLAIGYALCFRFLKRNYSPQVRARADALIRGAAAQ